MSFARSKDGFHYKKDGELVRGLATEGAISPSSSFTQAQSSTFDLIVIGAGYAGLVAARDASVAGLKVLLVEARDRVGGRTWTSQVDGEKFEMGGTWIHWQQGFVWRELARYGIDRDLKQSPNEDHPSHSYNMARRNGIEYRQPYAENVPFIQRAMDVFANVDGDFSGQNVVPMPPHLLKSILTEPSLVQKYDNMSVAERVKEVEQKGLLSNEELAYVCSYIELCFGNTLEKCSMLIWLKWWTHGNCSYKSLNDLLLAFKIKEGQSHLARRIFEEAKSTGRLSYSFDSPVQKVVDRPEVSQVTTNKGSFAARRIISTLPINVADKVEFDPPLPTLKRQAFAEKHVNQCLKVHSEISLPEYRSWTGNLCDDDGSPRELICALGDQQFASGNTAVVAFGINYQASRAPSKDPKRIARAFGRFDPALEKHYVSSTWTEWGDDPFAMGAWAMPSPGFTTKYLKALQERSGNILWASADWADGWNSFIDGACEQGTKAAWIVVDEWRKEGQKAKL